MPRDPLQALKRLRRLETATAQKLLAERLAGLAQAEQRAQAASAALAEEAAHAEATDYATWLPRGLAERDRALRLHAHATQRVSEAQLALAAARSSERVVEKLQAQKAESAQQEAQRREQLLLDEVATRQKR